MDFVKSQTWLTQGVEERAQGYAISEIIPSHFASVRDHKLKMLDKIAKAVKDRMTQEIQYWDFRAIDLKEKEAAGKETFAERERIITAANDEAAKILKKARDKANSEHDRIISEAQKEIAEIVNEATEKIVLDSNLDTYDEFLNAANKDKGNV